jgi:hypothetical protein
MFEVAEMELVGANPLSLLFSLNCPHLAKRRAFDTLSDMQKQHAKECFAALDEAHNECTCDGYHTFEELYDHRITLFITLCRVYDDTHFPGDSWRSKVHRDGSMYQGQFILGLFKEKGRQITYHVPIERWKETEFVAETLGRTPEWDGHSSADVIDRLKQLS